MTWSGDIRGRLRMTEAGLQHFLCKQGLADNRVDLLKLKGGYLNTVWRVDTGTHRLVAKHFATPMTGTLFPNLPDDEAEALRRLTGLDVAPRLVGYWPDNALLVYDYVEGEMWQGDVTAVADLLLRKEAADPTGFRTVPLTSREILAQGDALFARCTPSSTQADTTPLRPAELNLPPPARLSLVHTDIGGNLVGAGDCLRLIDWQCPAAGDICEDIYGVLSPAFQILSQRTPLSQQQIYQFWTALDRPELYRRYQQVRPFFAWRFAAYCCWREEKLDDAVICARYRRASIAELAYMETGQ